MLLRILRVGKDEKNPLGKPYCIFVTWPLHATYNPQWMLLNVIIALFSFYSLFAHRFPADGPPNGQSGENWRWLAPRLPSSLLLSEPMRAGMAPTFRMAWMRPNAGQIQSTAVSNRPCCRPRPSSRHEPDHLWSGILMVRLCLLFPTSPFRPSLQAVCLFVACHTQPNAKSEQQVETLWHPIHGPARKLPMFDAASVFKTVFSYSSLFQR
jgi:hypothetical protein